MAPSRNADRSSRENRERLRRYRARQAVFAHQVRRRRRDNIVAIAGVVLVAALATVTQVAYFTAGPGMPVPEPSASSSPSPDAQEGQNVGEVPSADIAEDRTWTGTLELNDVPLAITIDGAAAPQAASVFISLVQDGYYLQNACHRLTTGEQLRVLQCGQPDGANSIDPGFSFGPVENAPADGMYPAGTIAMARTDSEYGQSTQFFVCYADSFLDPSGGGYTVIGRVTSGLDRFTAEIANAGVAAGGPDATDGAPAVPTVITAVSLQ